LKKDEIMQQVRSWVANASPVRASAFKRLSQDLDDLLKKL